jgi:hypothetical protein
MHFAAARVDASTRFDLQKKLLRFVVVATQKFFGRKTS